MEIERALQAVSLAKNKIAENFPTPWYLNGDPVRHLCASPRPGILGEEEKQRENGWPGLTVRADQRRPLVRVHRLSSPHLRDTQTMGRNPPPCLACLLACEPQPWDRPQCTGLPAPASIDPPLSAKHAAA